MNVAKCKECGIKLPNVASWLVDKAKWICESCSSPTEVMKERANRAEKFLTVNKAFQFGDPNKYQGHMLHAKPNPIHTGEPMGQWELLAN